MRRMDGLYIKVLAAIIFYRMQDPRWENEIIEAVEISRNILSSVRLPSSGGRSSVSKECRYDRILVLKDDISGNPRGSHLLSVFHEGRTEHYRTALAVRDTGT